MIPTSNDLRIEVTTKCNYNCIICPRDKFIRPKETMSTDLFKELVDKVLAETDQYDTVTFPGMGEPFLDPDLLTKVKFVKEKGLKALILTNGSMLTPEVFKEFEDAGTDSIRISFYGMNEDDYCRVHGISNQDLFRRLLDSLLTICEQKANCELLFTFNIVEGVNENSLDDCISLWKDRADLLEVWRPHNWVDAKTYRSVQKTMKKSCGRPFTGPLQVQVDGTVNMCCFDYNGVLLLGDLKTQSLAEIFSGAMYRKIVHCHTTGDYAGQRLICEHCDQRNEDKSDVMVYNSRFKIEDRVQQTSSTYNKINGVV